MSLLSENAAKVTEEIHTFLNDNPVQSWNTLELVKNILSKFLVVNIEEDIATVTSGYQDVLEGFTNSDNNEKSHEAKRRLPALAGLMVSSHIKMLFQGQEVNSSQESAVLTVKNQVTIKAQQQMEQEQSSSKRQNEPYQLRSSKRNRPSTPSLKELSPEEVFGLLCQGKDCRNGVLDFTKPISLKFKNVIPSIIDHYKFNLVSAVTLEERHILIELSLCSTLDDEDELVASLFTRKRSSENIRYLRTAINGLSDIWRSKRLNDSNDEGWLRSNLYSFIWDRAFLFDDTFYVKRAECYSAVIRKLKENNEDVAQQRVDFILRSNHDGRDYLTLEEKPTDQDASNDFNKGKKMQQHMLKLWSNWLGSRLLVGELEAVTCQWQERKLTVFGTRILPSGHFIVYKKATALISTTSCHHPSASRLLQIVLSVKRLVTLNHMKLTAMIDAIEKYSNNHLDLSVNTDQPFVTFYGSSQESESSIEETDEPDYVQEALLRSKAVKHPDDVVGAVDWEKMFIDDVNDRLCSKN